MTFLYRYGKEKSFLQEHGVRSYIRAQDKRPRKHQIAHERSLRVAKEAQKGVATPSEEKEWLVTPPVPLACPYCGSQIGEKVTGL